MSRKFDRMPDLPQTIENPQIEEFLEHYYATSNESSDHDLFAEMFASDGEYAFNSQVAKGHDEIVAMRKKMWEEIPGRDHYPFQIFTHGHDEMELMVRGKAEHQHHSGDQVPHEWAAYYKLVEENGQIKFQQIHIILDSAADP